MTKIFAIVFWLTLSVNVFAQGNGGITGTVTDDNGAKVAGAQVVLTSGNGVHLNTSTDQDGAFAFKNLRSGSYFIEVKTPGFSTFTSEEIRFTRGENNDVPVQLKIAAINASVVVTATGTAQRADEVSKVVSTIHAGEIESRHELSLTEALRGTPGVRVQQQGSPGSLTTLRLRGQRNFDTTLLLDGLRVRDAGDINGSALSLMSDLSPVALDRVEVLRGAGSSIYGTHAIGGVVNMIPDSGSQGFHLNAGFDGGSLATYRERLEASGGNDLFGFKLGVNRVDVRNGIDGDDAYGNTGFAGRLQLNPRRRSRLQAISTATSPTRGLTTVPLYSRLLSPQVNVSRKQSRESRFNPISTIRIRGVAIACSSVQVDSRKWSTILFRIQLPISECRVTGAIRTVRQSIRDSRRLFRLATLNFSTSTAATSIPSMDV